MYILYNMWYCSVITLYVSYSIEFPSLHLSFAVQPLEMKGSQSDSGQMSSLANLGLPPGPKQSVCRLACASVV